MLAYLAAIVEALPTQVCLLSRSGVHFAAGIWTPHTGASMVTLAMAVLASVRMQRVLQPYNCQQKTKLPLTFLATLQLYVSILASF